jgi:hypothetical protein
MLLEFSKRRMVRKLHSTITEEERLRVETNKYVQDALKGVKHFKTFIVIAQNKMVYV